jgi:hypothetical protein
MRPDASRRAEQFDKDRDGFLNRDEHKLAREHLFKERAGTGMRMGPPGFRPREENQTPPAPGEKLSPADVTEVVSKPVYDPDTVRTLFLGFENEDWEKELAD